MNQRLSKSQYIKGRRCLRRVWLYNYHKDLMVEPSLFQKQILEQGQEVGKLARDRFPGGELIHETYYEPEQAIEHTQRAIAAGKKVIYEAAFLADDILIRADILVRAQDHSWSLYEVKSSTKIKTAHLQDLAVQKHVLQQLGLSIGSVHLLHLNPDYIYQTQLDLDQLFCSPQLDQELEKEMLGIQDYIQQIRNILSEVDKQPEAMLGSVCKSPYPCEYRQYCWRDVASTSILYLPHMTRNKHFDQLWVEGVRDVSDLSDYASLTKAQAITAQCFSSGKAYVDLKPIKKYLATLKYPLYFLDFEGVGFAIPRYTGSRPYRQLPFQYSLHIQESSGSEYQHRAYLHTTNSDPSAILCSRLIKDIGASGSVVVYHKTYEQMILRDLAERLPQYAAQIQNIIERLWDLELPFSKRWYCKPEFGGRSSIKFVLPGLLGNKAYERLAVHSGDQALAVYLELIAISDSEVQTSLYTALWEYCKQDTWAMVEILGFLKEQVARA